ncbi:ParB-like chromosome segregation protein Spo0J [Saccharothrix ecbatanensis]|uniref:ParB-like chromosome segregation protein Spo0J n=1 Tax=Saccharothrix ecbatanensis TaxID=1105145 RepID=A0A7W9HJC0_9PSEU|nr:ParB N-terminal domain-containing protein [Saccharothrix ecbatanensis]MBB5803265.1 ParB-like chromosome segregation protein Spo0J [Saccharothrix ecbatanensis]
MRDLRAADSPRIEGENSDHAGALAESGAVLPPIVVHQSTMRVVDGMHRLRAAMLRGDEFIDVVFVDGTDADAFVLAVELNHAHGLPLSAADRKAAAIRIMGYHPYWSDRRIAAVTGLAASTVGLIRARSTDRIEQLNTRVGQDGRVRPHDSAESRRLAGELIASNPDASLREIAKAAGISPATASDVRARLARGELPVTPHQRRASEIGVAAARRAEAAPVKFIENLRKDPSLRFSETGRALLRLLDCHVMDQRQWDDIIQSVPAHQRSTVVLLARECATIWQGFADRLARWADDTSPRGPQSA